MDENFAEIITARKAIVEKTAVKYGLAVSMVCALVEQETGGTWDIYTARYEPLFYSHYIYDEEKKLYRIAIPVDSIRSIETEAKQRATSWGLMQIMGQTARELGYIGRYLSALCDPAIGLDYGCKKLQHCFSVHGADETGLLAYNGGGNAAYGQQVLARADKYA